MKFFKVCPLCSSKEFSKLFDIEDYNYKLPGCFEEYSCSKCGLIFLNPYLEEHELSFYYPHNYYSYKETHEHESKSKIKKLITNYLLNPINIWNTLWELANKRNLWARYLSKNRQGRLLDIGCGSAGYLKHMRNLNPEMELFGCDAYGPEKNESLDGLSIIYRKLSLFRWKFPDGVFDIVTMNHILEHIPNPKELLSEIRRILKPNGHLIIGVPNTRSLSCFLFGKYWQGFDPPRHILNYSDRNLIDMLILIGFKVYCIKFIGNGPYFYQSIVTKVSKIKGVTGLWSKQWFSCFFIAGLNPLVWITNMIRLGDCIEVYANKK